MHISDGILSGPVLATGWGVCAAGLVHATRNLEEKDLPRVAVMVIGLFVASFLHVGATHLSLIAVLGIVLRRQVFLGVAMAVFLQALLTAHGGLTAIGVTTSVMALPAWLAGTAFGAIARRCRPAQLAPLTALLAVGSTVLAVTLHAAALALSSSQYGLLATFQAAMTLPLIVIEAAVSASVIVFLHRVKPSLIGTTRPQVGS